MSTYVFGNRHRSLKYDTLKNFKKNQTNKAGIDEHIFGAPIILYIWTIELMSSRVFERPKKRCFCEEKKCKVKKVCYLLSS